jgi:hypothetical protein
MEFIKRLGFYKKLGPKQNLWKIRGLAVKIEVLGM